MVAKWTPSIRFAHPRRLRPPPERPGARGIGPGGQNSTFCFDLFFIKKPCFPRKCNFSEKKRLRRVHPKQQSLFFQESPISQKKKAPAARPPEATELVFPRKTTFLKMDFPANRGNDGPMGPWGPRGPIFPPIWAPLGALGAQGAPLLGPPY